jgi:hypothetical protein
LTPRAWINNSTDRDKHINQHTNAGHNNVFFFHTFLISSLRAGPMLPAQWTLKMQAILGATAGLAAGLSLPGAPSYIAAPGFPTSVFSYE